jgi:DNA-binding response OmpR family regulator
MRILFVEDEPEFGSAIKRSLTQEAYVVDWVQDGLEAWGYLEYPQAEYNLAIFDWLLPGLSGVELCQRSRKLGCTFPILMLTAKDAESDKVAGLDAGADDYLVKPFGMAELLARLRALQRRSPQVIPQKLQRGFLSLDYGSRTLFYKTSLNLTIEITLTNKEFQLLEYFMRHPYQIVTRDQIMLQVWEMAAEPGSNVVAAQMRLLRRKLEKYGCTCPIETVYGLGYRLNLNPM